MTSAELIELIRFPYILTTSYPQPQMFAQMPFGLPPPPGMPKGGMGFGMPGSKCFLFHL